MRTCGLPSELRLAADADFLAPETVEDRHEGEWRDLVVEAGLPESALPEVEAILDREANARAWQRVREAVQVIGATLASHSSHSAAVAHALGIACDAGGTTIGMQEIGARLGITKQAVGNATAQLRRSFHLVTAKPKPEPLRPDTPGEWLTTAEVRAQFQRGPDLVKNSLGVAPIRHLGRDFFEAGAIRAALAAREIETARARAERSAAELERDRRRRDAEAQRETEVRRTG